MLLCSVHSDSDRRLPAKHPNQPRHNLISFLRSLSLSSLFRISRIRMAFIIFFRSTLCNFSLRTFELSAPLASHSCFALRLRKVSFTALAHGPESLEAHIFRLKSRAPQSVWSYFLSLTQLFKTISIYEARIMYTGARLYIAAGKADNNLELQTEIHAGWRCYVTSYVTFVFRTAGGGPTPLSSARPKTSSSQQRRCFIVVRCFRRWKSGFVGKVRDISLVKSTAKFAHTHAQAFFYCSSSKEKSDSTRFIATLWWK